MNLMGQTVTVYREVAGEIWRQVLRDCYYRYEDTVDQNGFCRRFELISAHACPLFPGDRIYDGEGPAVDMDRWKHFLPETVAGLSVAQKTEACYLGKVFHHWKAKR